MTCKYGKWKCILPNLLEITLPMPNQAEYMADVGYWMWNGGRFSFIVVGIG